MIFMAACKCEHTLRKGGSHWPLLFIAWGPLKYKEVLNCFEMHLVPFKMESGRSACAWTAEGCSSLPLAHLFDGTRCWENTKGHSVPVLLPVVANNTVVARWESWLSKWFRPSTPFFLALCLSWTQNRTLHYFLSREHKTRASLSHLSQVLILWEIFERPTWLIQWAREHLLPLLSLS